MFHSWDGLAASRTILSLNSRLNPNRMLILECLEDNWNSEAESYYGSRLLLMKGDADDDQREDSANFAQFCCSFDLMLMLMNEIDHHDIPHQKMAHGGSCWSWSLVERKRMELYHPDERSFLIAGGKVVDLFHSFLWL